MKIEEILSKKLNSYDKNVVKYWDCRIQKVVMETFYNRDGVAGNSEFKNEGTGVRILCFNTETGKSGWGFASTNILEKNELISCCELAFETAMASTIVSSGKLSFEPSEECGEYWTRLEIDPFKMSKKEKQDYVNKISEVLKSKETVSSSISIMFKKVKTNFINSSGSDIVQEIVYSGGGMSVTNSLNGEFATKSYPGYGNYRVGGFEIIEDYDLEENGKRIVKEATEILNSPECPSEVTTLLIGPQMMALLVHEVCGHATEFDRILGEESAYAGISFLKIEDIGKFKYGSDIVNIVSDPTYPKSAGSYGWDDDGTPANCQYLVKNGIIAGFLTGRENSHIIGRESAAANRASSYDKTPINRITSVNLLPGDKFTKDEIIAEVKNGYYVDDFCGWSINSDRNGFRFSVETMIKIEDGKLTQRYKNGSFSSKTTPEFWANCYAIAKDKPYVAGFTNCAKGQPVQIITVGHVVPQVTAFHNVKVGK